MSKKQKIHTDTIIIENLDQLIGEKFGNYSKYIIQERALPDLRDGLKPVQRRILYAMNDLRLSHKSPYKKSARVVGDVIGKYHPHGDTSVYEAMVRLAQEWKVNMPLVDMHGNKGSVDGDGAAAMRYTEARLAPISEQLLLNIEKNLVQFSPNFDDSELEPTILPSKIPNLLINGATGIAAGYSTNIPPHNLKEVIKAIIFCLKNESITLSNLTKYIKGPDFPTGAFISNTVDIKNAYKTGKGKIIITSKWEFNKKEKNIEITEIPYETNKADLVKKIDELVRENKVPGIKEIRDDTDRSGLLISLICKAEVNVELVMNYLFKKTDLRKSYSFNMVSIKDKKPQLLGLVDMVTSFADFQIEIYTKLYKFELEKLNKRMEIVEGLIKIVPIIDEIVLLIRNSKNKKEAKDNIIERFKFTENQTEAIVNLRLYRLTSTDINELKNEKDLLSKIIKHYSKGLNDKEYLKENIIKELEEISEKYGVKRKSEINDDFEEVILNEIDLIQQEDVNVSVTHQGYIKSISQRSVDASQSSDINTKGTPFGKREDDILISMVKTSNLNNIMLFSSQGRYFSIPIFKIGDYKWKDLGDHISKFTSLDSMDRIISIAIVNDVNKEGDLIISTKNGMIKRTPVNGLSINQTKKGSKYISLKENDEVVSIAIAKDELSFITTITQNGYGLRYVLENLSSISMTAGGVKNVNLNENDLVIKTIVSSISDVDNKNSQLIFITHNGKAKRIKINDIKGVSRGSKGSLIATQVKSNPFRIINAFNVEEANIINILTDEDETISIKTKTDVSISNPSTGLVKIYKTGIKAAFNDLNLDILSLKKFDENKHEEKIQKNTQDELDALLEEF